MERTPTSSSRSTDSDAAPLLTAPCDRHYSPPLSTTATHHHYSSPLLNKVTCNVNIAVIDQNKDVQIQVIDEKGGFWGKVYVGTYHVNFTLAEPKAKKHSKTILIDTVQG